MDKPKKLYRGIRLDFDKIKDFDFNGEIGLPFLYKFREDGMKLVQDGNEYGIYMSDNILMPLTAYGNSGLRDGTDIDSSIVFGSAKETVKIPPVCIIYEIDTEKIDIKEPWICDEMKGHYNNNFQGKEWITQNPVPVSCYSYAIIKIGPDHLHPEEVIEIQPGDDIKKILMAKYAERNEKLGYFLNVLKKIDEGERLRNDTDIKFVKEMCGVNGVAYRKYQDIEVTNVKSLKEKMLSKQVALYGFDLKTIRNINAICNRIKDDTMRENLKLMLRGGFSKIALVAIEMLTEKDLKDLGVTYCHFSNNNAHIVFDNYNIKLSANGELNITQFNKPIKLEDILMSEDEKSQNLKKAINILEDLRIEKEMPNLVQNVTMSR